jgi:hypothetical protein
MAMNTLIMNGHQGDGDPRQHTKVSLAAKTPPSKGVSLGPQMRASQEKKSDSEIGPAVNMPSGEPPEVSCLYSVINRRRAVALFELLEAISFEV